MDKLIRQPMEALEARLRELVRSDVAFVELIGEDLVAAGGKRIRPALAFLTGRAIRGTRLSSPANLLEVDWAACIELLHSASLLHDDLIDDAETRRGREAAFRRYGNIVSVFAGDFLLSRQLELLANLPDAARFVRLIAQTSKQICEGEVLQFQVAALQTYSLEHYLEIITGKTAALTAAACQGAAMLASDNQHVIDAFRTFGLEYGRAFQIRDDLLDLTADEATLGKPTGGDLREGKATLPVLHLLTHANGDVREQTHAILTRRATQPGDLETMQALARDHGAIEHSKLEIRHRAERAAQALAVVPPSPARQALENLALREAERVA